MNYRIRSRKRETNESQLGLMIPPLKFDFLQSSRRTRVQWRRLASKIKRKEEKLRKNFPNPSFRFTSIPASGKFFRNKFQLSPKWKVSKLKSCSAINPNECFACSRTATFHHSPENFHEQPQIMMLNSFSATKPFVGQTMVMEAKWRPWVEGN